MYRLKVTSINEEEVQTIITKSYPMLGDFGVYILLFKGSKQEAYCTSFVNVIKNTYPKMKVQSSRHTPEL